MRKIYLLDAQTMNDRGIYRTIHCCIWADKDFNTLSTEEKFVWFHLLTNPFASATGIYNASLAGLAANARMDYEIYARSFDKISSVFSISHDPEAQVFYVGKYLMYNKPANPNVFKSILKPIKLVTECPLRYAFVYDSMFAAEAWGEGFMNVWNEHAKPYGER
jgi:hypothetical protein